MNAILALAASFALAEAREAVAQTNAAIGKYLAGFYSDGPESPAASRTAGRSQATNQPARCT